MAGLAAIVCAIPGKKFFEAVEPDGSDATKPTAFSPDFLVWYSHESVARLD
jgi:hypothetical protein